MGEEELKRNGWVRQFIAGEPRLSEAVEFYQSLGFEVRLEPVNPGEMGEECLECYYKEECDKYKIIYIRKIED